MFYILLLVCYVVKINGIIIEKQIIEKSNQTKQHPGNVTLNDREKNTNLDNTSTGQNNSRGFVLNHNIDMISVEQAKSNERIEYSESTNEKGSGKNKIPKKKENWSKNGKIQINHLKKHLLQHKKTSKAHMRSAKPQDEPPSYTLPPIITVPPPPVINPPIITPPPPPEVNPPIITPPPPPAINPPIITAPPPPAINPPTSPPPIISLPIVTTQAPIVPPPTNPPIPPTVTTQIPIIPTITIPTNITVTTFETTQAPTIPTDIQPPVSIYTSPSINQPTITIPISTEIVTTNLPITLPPTQALTTYYTTEVTSFPLTTTSASPTPGATRITTTEILPTIEATTPPSIPAETFPTPITMGSTTQAPTTLIPVTLTTSLPETPINTSIPSIPIEPIVPTTPVPIDVTVKPIVPTISPPATVAKPPQLSNHPVLIPPNHGISQPIYIQGGLPISGSGGVVPPQANPMPPPSIDECPAEVESMGCYAFGKFPKRLFKTVITTLKQDQTFEELFCECGSLVEKRGWTIFALSNGKCFSGKNENGFDKGGVSDNCFNEDGEICSDNDTYCVGDKSAISVYGIINEETRSFIVESSSKSN